MLNVAKSRSYAGPTYCFHEKVRKWFQDLVKLGT